MGMKLWQPGTKEGQEKKGKQAVVCAQMRLPMTASANRGDANSPKFQHEFAKVPASFALSSCLFQNA